MIKASDIVEAQKRLDEYGFSIITTEEWEQWNREKNTTMMYERDVKLKGWVEEDGLLIREFYIKDPDDVHFGIYRKAFFCFTDDDPKDFVVTDWDYNEVEKSAIKSNRLK